MQCDQLDDIQFELWRCHAHLLHDAALISAPVPTLTNTMHLCVCAWTCRESEGTLSDALKVHNLLKYMRACVCDEMMLV